MIKIKSIHAYRCIKYKFHNSLNDSYITERTLQNNFSSHLSIEHIFFNFKFQINFLKK